MKIFRDLNGPVPQTFKSVTDKNETNYIFEFDDRTRDAALKYVGSTTDNRMPIWARPWIEAQRVKRPVDKSMRGLTPQSWPVEWRIYVIDSQVVGVSNYYLHLQIPHEPKWIKDALKCAEYTARILVGMKFKNIQPWHPRYIGSLAEDNYSFTLDFISTESGPMMLEGGPAVPVDANNIPVREWGGHPCCFIGRPVKGIALGPSVEPIDFEININ